MLFNWAPSQFLGVDPSLRVALEHGVQIAVPRPGWLDPCRHLQISTLPINRWGRLVGDFNRLVLVLVSLDDLGLLVLDLLVCLSCRFSLLPFPPAEDFRLKTLAASWIVVAASRRRLGRTAANAWRFPPWAADN